VFTSTTVRPVLQRQLPSALPLVIAYRVIVFQEIEQEGQMTFIVVSKAEAVAFPKVVCAKSASVMLQSGCGSYLCVKSENMPKCVFIYNSKTLKINSVVIMRNVVTSLAWHPKKVILSICTGIQAFGLWTPIGCFAVHIPGFQNVTDLLVKKIVWSATGNNFIVVGHKTAFIGIMTLTKNTHEEKRNSIG
jgi:hypothetical protein